MIQFFLLSLFYPMIDWAYFLVALDNGYANPVVERLKMRSILDKVEDTFLEVSTNLMGKSPPVRLRTSLSVTSDLRLMTADFLTLGTWGRYFHSSSLIILKIIN
jgi:hypothetical protein